MGPNSAYAEASFLSTGGPPMIATGKNFVFPMIVALLAVQASGTSKSETKPKGR